MSTFDIMMQGFYSEFQGRSKTDAFYIARFEGKLNVIWIKHQNRVSEVESARYIQTICFMDFRKHIEKQYMLSSIHPKWLHDSDVSGLKAKGGAWTREA